jgi:glycyl-tRNA synthetase beta chain
MNIAVKCDNKVTVDPSAFENDQENALYVKYQKVAMRYMESKEENERFEQLVSLQTEIESYFENTMVMAEDEAIRNNRLSLMKEISDLVAGFAAMNKIILT